MGRRSLRTKWDGALKRIGRAFGRGPAAPAVPIPGSAPEDLSAAADHRSYDIELQGQQSWSKADDPARRAGVLARWRTLLRFVNADHAAAFLAKCGERPERTSGQFTLMVSARPITLQTKSVVGRTEATEGECVLLDVEAAHASLPPSGLRELDADAKGLRKGLLHDVYVSRIVEYEFIDLRLPDAIRGPLDDDVVRSALRAQDRDLAREFTSSVASHSQMRLSVGPEKPGAILAVARYVEERLRAASYGVFDSKGYRRLLLVPPAMAACLVLSWFLPLNWPCTLAWFGLFAVLLGIVVATLWRKVPPRHFFLRARTGSALFFFVIAAFATAYAVADLFDPNVLASDKATNVGLGNAYLVATGITFTAGVLTAPLKGLGLQIAHVQMIVFMATIVNVAIAILRLERPEADQQRA